MGAGDELTLRVSIAYADRHDAALVNLRSTLARLRMRVWRHPAGNGCADYARGPWGPILSTASAMADELRPTSIDINISAENSLQWLGGGRLGWSLQGVMGGTEGSSALCWGAMHLRPGLGMPPLFVLTDDGDHAATDEEQLVIV